MHRDVRKLKPVQLLWKAVTFVGGSLVSLAVFFLDWLGRFRRRMVEGAHHERARVAFAMALAAAFAACVTYSASEHDGGAVDCERTLGESQMYDLSRRQSALNVDAEHHRFAVAYNARQGEAFALRRRADALRRLAPTNSSVITADVLDVDAQVELAGARLLKPVRDFTDAKTSPYLTAERERQAREGAALREIILRQCRAENKVFWRHESAGNDEAFPTDFESLTKNVESLHHFALLDLFAAILFAVALILFTATELFGGALRRAIEWIGYGVGILVTGWAIWSDGVNGMYFLVAGGLFIVALIVESIVIYVVRQLRETPAQHVGEQPDQGGRGWRNAVVLAIAAVTLSEAIAGFYYMDARAKSVAAASKATEDQVEMVRSSTRNEARAYSVIGGMMQLRDTHLRADAVRDVLHDVARLEGVSPDSLLWNREAARWRATLDVLVLQRPYDYWSDALEPTIRQLYEGPDGPDRDSYFPERYFTQATVETPARLFAERDSEDELRAAWDTRAINFLVAAAIFTFTLYLFGNSLEMLGRNDLGFRAGTTLVIIGVGMGVAAWIELGRGWTFSIPANNDVALPALCSSRAASSVADDAAASVPRDVAAAVCYATAEVLAKEHADLDALKAYEESLRLRPGFTVARFLAAEAAGRIVAESSASHGESVVTTLSSELQLVGELSGEGLAVPAQLRQNIAFDTYLLGMELRSRGILRAAAAQTHDLLDAGNHASAALEFHLGLADLADGRDDDARHVYAAAIRTAIGEGDVNVAADAMTDLELLAARCEALRWNGHDYCDRLRLVVGDLESSIVKTVWPSRSGASAIALRGEGTQFAVLPSGLGWRTKLQPEGKRSDSKPTLVMVVSHAEASSRPWRILPELSYQVNASKLYRANGWLSGFRSALIQSRYVNCLDLRGRYRVNFYRDGIRVPGTRDFPAGETAAFLGAAFTQPQVIMCRPASWKPIAERRSAVMNGFVSPDGHRHAYAFAFFGGRHYGETHAREARTMRRTVELVLVGSGKAAELLTLQRSPGSCRTYFDNVEAPNTIYTTPSLTMLTKAWTTADGLVHVAMVSQPHGAPDELTCKILTSMTALPAEPVVPAFGPPSAGHALLATRWRR